MESASRSITRRDSQRATDALRNCLASVGLPAEGHRLGRRLAGGRNHLVFEVRGRGRESCLKIFRGDCRDGFRNELRLLAALASPMASRIPALIAFDENRLGVLMSRVPGHPLSVEDVTRVSAEGTLATLKQLYAIDPAPLRLSEVRWPPWQMFLRTRSLVGQALGRQAQTAWESSADRLGMPELLGPDFRRPCVGRGDPALDNILWDQRVARLVDFEAAGRSDVPHEVAEFLEHPQQSALDAHFKAELIESLLEPEELLSLAASRWLLRSFWSTRATEALRASALESLIRVESLTDNAQM